MGRRVRKEKKHEIDLPPISDGPFGYLAGNGIPDQETKEERNLRMLRAQHAADAGPKFPEATYSQDALRRLLGKER